ncbi:putative penicillin-binding protein [Exophiala viscosa]|uniref:putative penicillin-binding protein n=1 Tax=Exophiala viscosa TaxID=2486360 RepID=UPI00219DC8C6|nr:putative penicillin-binding protein [Exophiala viscosa]
MASFDEVFRLAANPGPDRKIPGAVLVAADRSGKICYLNCQGTTSVDEALAQPITSDHTFWIASCTKLMTTIAVLRCVDKGLLHLDEDISPVLPEFKYPDILVGFDSNTGEPRFQKASNKITLRQLLTHSSGMGYSFASPKLVWWRKWVENDPESFKGNLTKQFNLPLIYDPGEGWEYSVSVDWAGQMVERVNGGVRLGDYMKQHIWDPLDMKSTTFRAFENGNEHIRDRLCPMTRRTGSGILKSAPPYRRYDWKDDYGGQGVCCSPNDFIILLGAVLKNDGTVLMKETVEMMFQPHLSDDSYLNAHMAKSIESGMLRSGVESYAWNFGLGGILNMKDVDGLCKKGTMTWSGYANTYWWVDPSAGTCGMYASQLLATPSDPVSLDLYLAFRRHVYQQFASK